MILTAYQNLLQTQAKVEELLYNPRGLQDFGLMPSKPAVVVHSLLAAGNRQVCAHVFICLPNSNGMLTHILKVAGEVEKT